MKYPYIFALATFLLAGCEDETTVITNNIAPSISVEDATVIEKAQIDVTITAEDTDGTINNIEWTQITGPTAQADLNNNILTITAPEMLDDGNLTFELKATDNDGASATTEFSLYVTAQKTQLDLTGKVKGENFVGDNFQIWAEVGEQVFETEANELGNFTLPLNVDDSLLNHAIVLYAASRKNSIAKLGAVLPAVANLLPKAENDTFKMNESGEYQLTAHTTAALALVKSVNGKIPKTYDEYQIEFNKIDLAQLVDLTIFNTLLFDEVIGDYSYISVTSQLSEDFNNNVDAVDAQLFDAPIKALKQMNNGYEWKNKMEELFNDATSSLLESDLIPFVYLEGKRLQFNSNGTGYWLDFQTGEFNWTIEEGIVTINFKENSVYYMEDNRFNPANFLTEVKLSSKYSHNNLHLLEVEQKYTRATWDEPTTGETVNVFTKSTDHFLPPLSVIEMNKEYFLDVMGNVDREFETMVNDSNYSVGIKTATFNLSENSEESGSVELLIDDLSETYEITQKLATGTWQVTDNQLLINFEDQQFNLSFIKQKGDEYDVDGLVKNINNNELLPKFSEGRIREAVGKTAFSAEDIENKYVVFEPSEHATAIEKRWYEFHDDGTFLYVFIFDKNNNGRFEDYTDTVGLRYGLWKIEDGKLVMLRHRANRFYGIKSACTGGTWTPSILDECVADGLYTWHKLENKVEDTLVIKSLLLSFEDPELQRAGFDNASPFSVDGAYDHVSNLTISNERPVELPDSVFEDVN